MSAPGKATVARADYARYIQSPEWRAVRERYWASKLPQECHCCGAPRRKGFHLHHRTYKNLGNERLMDLVPVCPDCHDAVHRLYRSDPKWKRIGLWGATKSVRRQRRPRVPYRATDAVAARRARRRGITVEEYRVNEARRSASVRTRR